MIKVAIGEMYVQPRSSSGVELGDKPEIVRGILEPYKVLCDTFYDIPHGSQDSALARRKILKNLPNDLKKHGLFPDPSWHQVLSLADVADRIDDGEHAITNFRSAAIAIIVDAVKANGANGTGSLKWGVEDVRFRFDSERKLSRLKNYMCLGLA